MSAADTIRDALEYAGWNAVADHIAGDKDPAELTSAALRALDELQAELERLTVGRATLEDQTNRAELAEARVEALHAALWAINDWLADTTFGHRMPAPLRRQCGEALAVLSGGSE